MFRAERGRIRLVEVARAAIGPDRIRFVGFETFEIRGKRLGMRLCAIREPAKA
jgi:hypothetical protein